MKNLQYYIDHSGDSVLERYSYSNEELELILMMSELDISVRISIKTTQMTFAKFHLEKQAGSFRVCRMVLEDLSAVLSTENGYYIPGNSFKEVMRQSKLNYNLAYGKKITEVKYMFSLVGYGRLISCLIADMNRIEIS